jgi:hypothetical protein
MRFLFLAFALLAVFPGIAPAAGRFDSAFISEILAVNQRGLKDEDGGREPWIELHNGGSGTVNLAGWFLTDTPTNLTRWRFPLITLLADKSLVVFASGKDRGTNLAHLHTNFRLSGQGGFLALVNPATNIVSELRYGPQQADVPEGSVRGEPSLRGRLNWPTPGKPNVSSGNGFAPAVSLSRAGGNFTGPFTLRLSTPGTGAVIRHTLDGTLPNSSSPVLAGPIEITNTTYLRTRAWRDGLLPGPPRSEAFVQLSSNAIGFSSSLPLIVLDTFGRDAPAGAHGSFGWLSFHEPTNGRASLTNPPALATRVAFRVRGSSTGGVPQSSFALEFIDEFNEETGRPVPGFPIESDWILYAPNGYDMALIHNPFIHQLSRDMGRYSTRTRFVEVFWKRDAGRLRDTHYNGLYVLMEKIKISRHRVDIDRAGSDDLRPPKVTGGYLLKFDRLGPGESGLGRAGLVYVEPREATITQPQRAPQEQFLRKYFGDFEAALFGAQWLDPARGYRAYLDVDAAIDFHVLEVLSGNVDSLVLSTYLHKPRQGKITFGPHWDFDRALGSTDGRDENPRVWSTGQFFGGAWWPRLCSDIDFWQLWVDRWQELRQTHFSLTNMNALIDRLVAEVREAQPREYQKWGHQPRGGSFDAEIRHMRNWISNRVDFIDRQLTPPPALVLEGNASNDTVLKLALPPEATNATIYFTLDGSDPRLAHGGVSTNAMAYTNPVPLKAAARIMARAHCPTRRQEGGPPASTPWSRPVIAKPGAEPR